MQLGRTTLTGFDIARESALQAWMHLRCLGSHILRRGRPSRAALMSISLRSFMSRKALARTN